MVKSVVLFDVLLKCTNQNFIAFAAEPTVTALEVRRQKEQELRNNDLYWQRRLQQQELQLKQTNAILEKEYNETVCVMPRDYSSFQN